MAYSVGRRFGLRTRTACRLWPSAPSARRQTLVTERLTDGPEGVALDVADALTHGHPAAQAELEESVAHDFSTSEDGIVPLSHRRPLWHFAGLWLTFQSGFS